MRYHIRKDPFDPTKTLVAGPKAFRTWNNKKFEPGTVMPKAKGKAEVRRHRILWEQRYLLYEDEYKKQIKKKAPAKKTTAKKAKTVKKEQPEQNPDADKTPPWLQGKNDAT